MDLLTATSSSGLQVTYTSSNTAVATVSGSIVTIKGIGNTVITAYQAGDYQYNNAGNVSQLLTVSKADQTITFNALPEKKAGDAPFTLSATASSKLPVSYSSSNPAVARITGDKVSIGGVGSAIITASQDGDAGGKYNPAPPQS